MDMKKELIRHLSILLIFSQLLCVNVSAETVYTEGAFNYIIENGTIVITKYFGRESDVTVPSSINSAPVVTIASGAFEGSKAESITIPNTVANIEDGAIPDNVKQEIVNEPTSIYNEDEINETDDKEVQNNEDNNKIETNNGKDVEVYDIEISNNIEELEVADVNIEAMETGDIGFDNQTTSKDNNPVIELIGETNDKDYSYSYILVAIVAIALAIVIFKKKKK